MIPTADPHDRRHSPDRAVGPSGDPSHLPGGSYLNLPAGMDAGESGILRPEGAGSESVEDPFAALRSGADESITEDVDDVAGEAGAGRGGAGSPGTSEGEHIEPAGRPGAGIGGRRGPGGRQAGGRGDVADEGAEGGGASETWSDDEMATVGRPDPFSAGSRADLRRVRRQEGAAAGGRRGTTAPQRKRDADGLSPVERRLLLRRLLADSRRVSEALDTVAGTQAALADMLTGRAAELRSANRDLRRKLDHADATVRALRTAIETSRRDGDDLRGRLAEADARTRRTQEEYERLRGTQTGDAARAVDDERRRLFSLLGQLLVQLPTARRRIEAGAEVTARDLLGMLRPLDAAAAQLGFTPIGTVGESTAFDPALHQPSAGFATPPEAGRQVLVQFVGWRYRDEILRRAQVLPA